MGGLSAPGGAPAPDSFRLRDLQRYIAALEARKGWDQADVQRCCFLMGEEVGELFGAVRRHDHRAQTDADGARQAVAHELVDVLNYLLAVANRYDIDLERAFHEKNSLNEVRTWPG